jgi:hypothetical protein
MKGQREFGVDEQQNNSALTKKPENLRQFPETGI